MSLARRLTLTVVLVALLSAAAYGAGWAIRPAPSQDPSTTPSASRDLTDRRSDPTTRSDPVPETAPVARPEPTPAPRLEPRPEPEPELVAGPALLAPGDDSQGVAELQARLKQIDWFADDVTGFYGDVTTEAVRGFQGKREIPVTGAVDQRTLDRLHDMTTEPTQAELTNQVGGNLAGALDPRCRVGRVLCVDKTSRTLRWVVDGQVLKRVDTRFGGEATPTREGVFSVSLKSRDHVSSLYETPMPFAMFFSGGQAVHYSPDFAAVGYAGASHGCVNVRDYDAIAWIFDQVQVGDKVVVSWS